MTETPTSRSVRLPDWWRTKPKRLPGHTTNSANTTDPGPATDWWDELYDGTPRAACPHEHTVSVHARPTGELVALLCTDCDEQMPPPDAEDDTPARPDRWQAQPDYYPRPHWPAVVTEAPSRAALSDKTRAALYNASAAGTGWGIGLYQPLAHALTDCGTNYSIGGALTLGVGGCLVIAHFWDRRTRHWWPPIAWAARIPLATAIVALAIYAPAA